ncbi:MAG: hypothetical protein B6242_14920 [Anaerolineaceae bacterium 4572_78]|nr:MAG: hypothetical protein B6242_14920 [Anaerolineaceae bacterium 4572_78]
MTHEMKVTCSHSLTKLTDSPRFLYVVIGVLAIFLLIQVTQNQMVLRRQFTSAGSAPPPLLIGKQISPATLLTTDGQTFELGELSGKYHLFVFFNTQCSYCELDLSLWKTMYARSQSKNIDMVAITLEKDVNAVTKYVQKNSILFPVLIDENQELFNQLGILGTPAKAFLSADMRVLQIWYGWTTQRSNPSDLGAMLAFLGVEPEEIPLPTDEFFATPLLHDK